ncbi:hypothetical protein IAD21_00905 [Abditibacteriota bacterium]|nr:hypothetical protein IAD21_00905 [Abditibacteriota bacterium]
MARPTKFNDARMNAIVTSLRNGSTRRAAAAAAGVSESRFYDWMNRGETEEEFREFRESVMRAEAECENAMAKVIITAAKQGDWRASESWLKRRRKEDWSERSEVSGPNGEAVPMAIQFIPYARTDTDNS